MKQIAICASALTRQFSSVRALNDLTIEVPAGVVFGFLGPNGAGKTTTIRLLLNLIEPTSGRAEVLGFDTRTHGHEIRSRCGSLLEHSGLYERLSRRPSNPDDRFTAATLTPGMPLESLLLRSAPFEGRRQTHVRLPHEIRLQSAKSRYVDSSCRITGKPPK